MIYAFLIWLALGGSDVSVHAELEGCLAERRAAMTSPAVHSVSPCYQIPRDAFGRMTP